MFHDASEKHIEKGKNSEFKQTIIEDKGSYIFVMALKCIKEMIFSCHGSTIYFF